MMAKVFSVMAGRDDGHFLWLVRCRWDTKIKKKNAPLLLSSWEVTGSALLQFLPVGTESPFQQRAVPRELLEGAGS